MPQPVVLREPEIRELVRADRAALAAVEHAFVWLSEGRAVMPPIMHIGAEYGDIDIKGAYVAGQPYVAVKIAAGFFGNRRLGLANSSGMVVVLSADTGHCAAVFLDNGYLTDMRTGIAGAVAAHTLARPGPLRVGVIGAGVQARYQVEALALVRPIVSLNIYSRSKNSGERYVAEMTERLSIPVRVVETARELVELSDLIVTTTPSTEALVLEEWLRAGQHITAMGSDLPGKQELDAAVLRRADVLVCDSVQQASTHGELQHVRNDPATVAKAVSLGDVISGRAAGRRDVQQITVCDLVGLGVQDTAIALHVMELIKSRRES